MLYHDERCAITSKSTCSNEFPTTGPKASKTHPRLGTIVIIRGQKSCSTPPQTKEKRESKTDVQKVKAARERGQRQGLTQIEIPFHPNDDPKVAQSGD
jgi:hypothetical protein